MKKILNLLVNPKLLVGLGGLFFALGFVDVEITNAHSLIEMGVLGKSSMVGFFVVLLVMLFKFMLIPFGYQIIQKFKKKK